MNDGHPDAAADPRCIERNTYTVPSRAQVDIGRADLQIAQGYLVQECRKPRITQSDFLCERIEFESEAGLQKRERRGLGPCLRRARDRVKRWTLTMLTLEAAEQLRQAPKIHI
jgi:hypothetical protein